MLVLHAISGPDAGDLSSVPSQLDFDASAPVKGLRVGYFPEWMKTSPATDVDRAALETVKKVGMIPVEVKIPDWPYSCLNVILFAESAAAFEDLTLSHGSTSLKFRCLTHGPTSSANHDSFPLWTSCRLIVYGERWPSKWLVYFLKWTCFWCPRCAMRC